VGCVLAEHLALEALEARCRRLGALQAKETVVEGARGHTHPRDARRAHPEGSVRFWRAVKAVLLVEEHLRQKSP
jgi:hypothetical protein